MRITRTSRTLAAMAGKVTVLAGLIMPPSMALAQRASENAVATAEDAFGGTVGQESTGIYSDSDIRGFSPQKAGNARIDGVYFDQVASFNGRIRAGSTMRVGFAALDYPFPAPTGIVDNHFRSSGNEAVLSGNLMLTPYNGTIEELDLQLPIVEDRLSVATGFGYAYNRSIDGASFNGYGVAIRPRLRFSGVEISPFYSVIWLRDINTRPVIIADGPFLPPRPRDRVYLGQDWAENVNTSYNYGVTILAKLSSDFSFRGGAFRSRTDKLHNFTEIFAVSDPSGLASHVLLADPRQDTYSDSGEAQFAWNRVAGDWQHRVLLGARGRDRHTETGGSDIRNFGTVVLGMLDPEAEPSFSFGDVNVGTIRQTSVMLGYFGKLAGVGQMNLGVQKAHYKARFRDAVSMTSSSASPWLYNGSVEFEPVDGVSLYVGYVRGLEDSGTAPETAANRNEQLPATLTKQIDGGVRIRIGESHLIASIFQIEKPYFTFDAGNRFEALGTVRHRGLELSFSGTLYERLQLIAGAVLMRPVVSGESVTLGQTGNRPVGTPTAFIRIDANYRTDILGGVTPTLSLVYTSRRASSSAPYAALDGKQLMVPGHVTLDLGLRHRFDIGKTPVSLRMTVANVFDSEAWRVLASNTYQADDRRRFTVSMLVDL